MTEYVVDVTNAEVITGLSDISALWGLPVRERVTRCKNCRWAHEAPPVEDWHLECRVRPLCRHYTPDMGFCHLGEPRVVGPTKNDVDAEGGA